MSPQERAERFAGGRMRVERMWGKSPLLAIVDDSISHFAFRVRSLFAVPTLQGGVIALSFPEIAEALSCSQRQVARAVAELEEKGYLEVLRRHNMRNAYSLKDAYSLVEGLEPIRRPQRRNVPRPCVRCLRLCGQLPEDRVCRSCVSKAKVEGIARRVVREELDKNPAA